MAATATTRPTKYPSVAAPLVGAAVGPPAAMVSSMHFKYGAADVQVARVLPASGASCAVIVAMHAGIATHSRDSLEQSVVAQVVAAAKYAADGLTPEPEPSKWASPWTSATSASAVIILANMMSSAKGEGCEKVASFYQRRKHGRIYRRCRMNEETEERGCTQDSPCMCISSREDEL